MKITKQTTAGSLESSDVLITLKPGTGIKINIESKFIKQYGDELDKITKNTLKELNVTDCLISLNDQGALPAVLRARIIASVERQGK